MTDADLDIKINTDAKWLEAATQALNEAIKFKELIHEQENANQHVQLKKKVSIVENIEGENEDLQRQLDELEQAIIDKKKETEQVRVDIIEEEDHNKTVLGNL